MSRGLRSHFACSRLNRGIAAGQSRPARAEISVRPAIRIGCLPPGLDADNGSLRADDDGGTTHKDRVGRAHGRTGNFHDDVSLAAGHLAIDEDSGTAHLNGADAIGPADADRRAGVLVNDRPPGRHSADQDIDGAGTRRKRSPVSRSDQLLLRQMAWQHSSVLANNIVCLN